MNSQSYTKALTDALSHKYRVFPSFKDYARYVCEELFPEPLIGNVFYQKMILWVLQNKSPIFFRQDHDFERLTYTGCYNISPTPPRVGRYVNDAIFSLFNLHEIVHQMFNYVRNIQGVGVKAFDADMSLRERIASNETEVWVYRRIPELRSKTQSVLPQIWFDVLSLHNCLNWDDLNVTALERMRRDWLEDASYDAIFAPYHPELRKYMAQFRHGNADFLAHRLVELSCLPELTEPAFPTLHPYTYEKALEAYIPLGIDSPVAQANYERNILEHVKLLYLLVGRVDYPTSFSEVFERLSETDSFVLLNPTE